MYEHCPACGQDLIGSDGAQYGGPMVFGYTVGGGGGVIVVLLLLAFGVRTELALAAGLVVAVATIALTWRHGKAAWTWLLYRTGQLQDTSEPRP
jgi:ABC-type enterobactin transport system permease subunit